MSGTKLCECEVMCDAKKETDNYLLYLANELDEAKRVDPGAHIKISVVVAKDIAARLRLLAK